VISISEIEPTAFDFCPSEKKDILCKNCGSTQDSLPTTPFHLCGVDRSGHVRPGRFQNLPDTVVQRGSFLQGPKSRLRKRNRLSLVSLRAPERCAAILLKRARLLRFPRNDNSPNRDLGGVSLLPSPSRFRLLAQLGKLLRTQILRAIQLL
jgi:hypothetical protein